MEDKKVLLSVKDLEVKFRVRGRILTAIRGISLDIYENESIAIVGESGSGKSVFTKTFAGMLDGNGFISNGTLVFSDDALADTCAVKGKAELQMIEEARIKLDEYSKLEFGKDIYHEMTALKNEKKQRAHINTEKEEQMKAEIAELKYRSTEAFNLKQTPRPEGRQGTDKAYRG